MSENVAVIDLGTNTFHLLVVKIEQEIRRPLHQEDLSFKHWEELFRKRIYIHLAEDGIETIGDKAFQRGLDALHFFSKTCQELNVTKIKACGTAALRTASNGPLFVSNVKSKCEIDIEIIDGDHEAKYIASGVGLAIPKSSTPRLIMDIGGGSVEFILNKNNQPVWFQSFPIGVAVLKKRFHHTEPISKAELTELFKFLDQQLQPLKEILAKEPSLDLVGASGTFDVLQNILTKINSGDKFSELTLDDFNPLAEKLIGMNLSQRLTYPNLTEERTELIVVALALIQFTLNLHSFDKLFVSKYAMKEGIISTFLES